MSPSSEFLSTQEVAGLFRITETTVKRWADDGILPCIKSPGGHRKFTIADVIGFAEDRGYPISGTLRPPLSHAQMERIRFALHAQNYHTIADVLFDEALQADGEGIFQLLLYVSKHNVKISTLADEILRPPMVRIGELWKGGKLRIDQEHRASRALSDAMVRLVPELHKKSPNGLVAVCACLEGERHEIGLRSLAFALETEGWAVHYVGADTPVRTVVESVRATKPALVCISTAAQTPDETLRRGFRAVGEAVRGVGGRFMAGGYCASGFRAEDLGCDHIAPSAADGIGWVRGEFGLRPGPKRGQRKSAGTAKNTTAG